MKQSKWDCFTLRIQVKPLAFFECRISLHQAEVESTTTSDEGTREIWKIVDMKTARVGNTIKLYLQANLLSLRHHKSHRIQLSWQTEKCDKLHHDGCLYYLVFVWCSLDSTLIACWLETETVARMRTRTAMKKDECYWKCSRSIIKNYDYFASSFVQYIPRNFQTNPITQNIYAVGILNAVWNDWRYQNAIKTVYTGITSVEFCVVLCWLSLILAYFHHCEPKHEK